MQSTYEARKVLIAHAGPIWNPNWSGCALLIMLDGERLVIMTDQYGGSPFAELGCAFVAPKELLVRADLGDIEVSGDCVKAAYEYAKANECFRTFDKFRSTANARIEEAHHLAQNRAVSRINRKNDRSDRFRADEL